MKTDFRGSILNEKDDLKGCVEHIREKYFPKFVDLLHKNAIHNLTKGSPCA